MTERDDTDYYRSRERQERALVEAAADAGAAAIHLELASRYAKLTAGAADLVSREHEHCRTDPAAVEPRPHGG